MCAKDGRIDFVTTKCEHKSSEYQIAKTTKYIYASAAWSMVKKEMAAIQRQMNNRPEISHAPKYGNSTPKEPTKRTYNVFAIAIAKSLQEPMLDLLRRHVTSVLIAVCDSFVGPFEVADVVGPDVDVHS